MRAARPTGGSRTVVGSSSHAKRRVTDPIRRAFTAAVQEFATHGSFSNEVAWS